MSTRVAADAELLLVTRRFRVEELTWRDRRGDVQRKAVVRHPGAVAIIPLVSPERVCLIRNYRVSLGRGLVELPAGTCEVGESTEATAHRELIEETGFRAERLTPLRTFFMSPGILDEAMHLFLAEGLIPGGASPEPGEEIENLIVSWPEAMAMIRNGQIEDAKTLVGLLYFDRFRAGP